MPLKNIRMMLNDSSLERAEATMQVQEALLERKISQLEELLIIVRDYKKSFGKAIQHLGEISIEDAPVMIYKRVGESMAKDMVEFNRLASAHVPKFTFVASPEIFLSDSFPICLNDRTRREEIFDYAITLIDDENLKDTVDFTESDFEIIPSRKCIHATVKAYTNFDYSDMLRPRDYIINQQLELKGNAIYRIISTRNNVQRSTDYYEFWAPIE